MSPARHHHALPEGYRLHWYQIDSILGQGGFGITYLARDSNLDQLVAIKEFLPSDYNWGLTAYGIPPGTEFDLEVNWTEGGAAHAATIEGIVCAPDVDKLK